MAERFLQRGADEARGPLGRLHGDVAGEAVGHDHVEPLADDVVALDKAEEFEWRLGPMPLPVPGSIRGPIDQLGQPAFRLVQLGPALDVFARRCSAGRRAARRSRRPAGSTRSPMMAYCTSVRASARTSAPMSSATLKPRALSAGQCTAIAGRSTPGALAQHQPWPWRRSPRCCPAVNATFASPAATDWSDRQSELFRPVRSAREGFSSIGTTSSACRISVIPAACRCLRSSRPSLVLVAVQDEAQRRVPLQRPQTARP